MTTMTQTTDSINIIPYNISTMTVCTKIPNCQFILQNIERYLDLDQYIIGIKSNDTFRGNYFTNKYKRQKKKQITSINKISFCNQISIIIALNTNQINVKLFKNGTLHLTGCRSLDLARSCIQILLERLNNMVTKSVKILLTKDQNGVLLDKSNFVYSYNKENCNKIIIGKIDTHQSGYYIIHDKTYKIDTKTGMFISVKLGTGKKYDILNFSGESIGFCQIQIIGSNKRLYNKHLQYNKEFDLICSKNGPVANFQYEISENLITNTSKIDDIQEIIYSCNPFVNSKTVDPNLNIDLKINCVNVSFNLGTQIRGQSLYKLLCDLNYICQYKPETYHGVKLIYKIPYDNNIELDGRCKCSKKCICNDVTFLIFQTGSVLATGFKNTDIITPICNKFVNLCHKYSHEIIVN